MLVVLHMLLISSIDLLFDVKNVTPLNEFAEFVFLYFC